MRQNQELDRHSVRFDQKAYMYEDRISGRCMLGDRVQSCEVNCMENVDRYKEALLNPEIPFEKSGELAPLPDRLYKLMQNEF